MSDLFRSAKPLDLRPYQLEAIEQVRAHIRAGAKNVCLVAPTGSGKTVIGSHLLNEASTKMRKSVFVVDRIIGKEIADEGQLPEDAGASREADRGA